VADEGTPTPEELQALQEQFASLGVEEFLVSAASTLASLAYAKLERGELAEAQKAIDAFAALAPHVGGDLGGELRLALTGLQVAYAEAASR